MVNFGWLQGRHFTQYQTGAAFLVIRSLIQLSHPSSRMF